jgi:hypothetical protein
LLIVLDIENPILPELSNSGSPQAKPGVYLKEIMFPPSISLIVWEKKLRGGKDDAVNSFGAAAHLKKQVLFIDRFYDRP